MMLCALCIFFFSFLHFGAGYSQLRNDICRNDTQWARSCITQILGDEEDISKCQVEAYPANSNLCQNMAFGDFHSNSHIGGISLRPYILSVERMNVSPYSLKRAVLNITFSNIKWKTMKFRFQPKKQQKMENHCRYINIANDVKINDRSLLYYDCYWPIMDDNYSGQSHILDFEANDGSYINRGRYYFNIPSAKMLSPTVTEKEWVPFVYIEIINKMRLHIAPPPSQLNITGYRIRLMKDNVELEKKVKLINNTEVTYDYDLFHNGTYYFVVTPLHSMCNGEEPECKSVESPKINQPVATMSICIASITALVVCSLFACYVAMCLIRRYWCKDYRLANREMDIPPPPKILFVYPSENRVFSQCVFGFVNYLRDFGFDILYDGDIAATSSGDPYEWAEEAFKKATHIVYIVPPREQTNLANNLYDLPIRTPYMNIDKILLSMLKTSRLSKCDKIILNVRFEFSNGPIPSETKHGKVYILVKDYQKLIAYLSKDLLPKAQIMRSERGKSFIDDLNRANKLLNEHNDVVKSQGDKIVLFC